MKREIELPSGAKLTITPAPFEDAEALFSACMEEIKGIRISDDDEVGANMVKDLFATAYSSKKVKTAIAKCMEKALYNGLRIGSDTFEPVKARQDYMPVVMEVAMENIAPFTKSLYAKFAQALAKLRSSRA